MCTWCYLTEAIWRSRQMQPRDATRRPCDFSKRYLYSVPRDLSISNPCPRCDPNILHSKLKPLSCYSARLVLATPTLPILWWCQSYVWIKEEGHANCLCYDTAYVSSN